jgi:phage-related tail fiber protein
MIDQTSQFFAILTNVGVAKQANADALGITWKITQMGVGDANGADPIPSATQTALINERRRAPLNQLKVDPANSAVIIAEQVIPAEVGGWWIREIGLYDADNDLVAIANCAPSFKPLLTQGSGRTQIVRMNLVVSNSASVELKIDPSVVLATRSYVDQKVLDELNKQDFKHSVLVATTGPIALNGLQTIDGVAITAGKRVLVKSQAASQDNGLYVAAVGAWARTDDADASAEMTPGLFVHVEQGTANSDSVWQLTTDAPIVLGTTALTFEMVVGRTGITAGTYRSITVDKNGRVIGATNPTTLAGNGIVDAYTKAEVEAMIAQASALPVGTQVSFPVNSIPPGFLERDGSVKSIALYPDLAAYLGGAFNRGDEGVGNFRLPESRGEHERGWDHGRGVDVGRAVGSWQDESFKSHVHSATRAGFMSNEYPNSQGTMGTGGSVTYAGQGLQMSATAATGGAETRGRNVAVVMCIKAWNAPINQGNVDIAALVAMVEALRVNGPVVGTARKLKASIPVAAPTVTYTADEIVLESGLGGFSYKLVNISATLNLGALTGLGYMDTGAAPVNSFVAVYLLYNPVTKLYGAIGVNATAVDVPEVYGGNFAPAGYTASALLGVLPTNASAQFKPGKQGGRTFHFPYVSALATSVMTVPYVAFNLAAYIPKNTRTVSGALACNGTGSMNSSIAADSIGSGWRYYSNTNAAGSAPFDDLIVDTPQTLYYSAQQATLFTVFLSAYTI